MTRYANRQNQAASRRRRRRAGFTITELLIVIAILAVLASISVVGLGLMRSQAADLAASQFLNNVSMAVAQYERDFGDYPPSYYDGNRDVFGLSAADVDFTLWSGGELLAQALVGPRADDYMRNGEPVAGMGYRQAGRDYGPYLDADSQRNLVYTANDEDDLPFTDHYDVTSGGSQYNLIDPTGQNTPNGRWGLRSDIGAWPILYYRAQPQGRTGAFDEGNEDNWAWGPQGRFNTTDNRLLLEGSDPGFEANVENQETEGRLAYQQRGFRQGWLGGDAGLIPAFPWSMKEEGARRNFATRLRSADFLLVAPGSDNLYGTENDITTTGP